MGPEGSHDEVLRQTKPVGEVQLGVEMIERDPIPAFEMAAAAPRVSLRP
jgi:hypothetical protein